MIHTVVLNTAGVTAPDVLAVARNDAKVEISAQALEAMAESLRAAYPKSRLAAFTVDHASRQPSISPFSIARQLSAAPP